MADQNSTGGGHKEVEKLLIQAETGSGRTAARPSAVLGIGGLRRAWTSPQAFRSEAPASLLWAAGNR